MASVSPPTWSSPPAETTEETLSAAQALDDERAPREGLRPEIQRFLTALYDKTFARNVSALHRLYEIDFNTLSESFYRDSRWPSPDLVDEYFRSANSYHSLVSCLYKEIYYRHLFDRCPNKVEMSDRINSWNNYHLLILYFIDEECELTDESGLHLPREWVWDLLDEFCYQFQECQLWRMRNARACVEDTNRRKDLYELNKCWQLPIVLQLLSTLVESSKIQDHFKKEAAKGTNGPRRRGSMADLSLTHQIGYGAMVCLSRVYILMGDYTSALASLDGLTLSARAHYWTVPACHITLFYHIGYAYMMLERYQDAIRIFSQILMFIGKTRTYLNSHSYQSGGMSKMVDRMYQLVMLCGNLSPSRLEEAVVEEIRSKFPDKYFKVQADDEDAIKEIFLMASPKFINPATFVPEGMFSEFASHLAADEPRTRQLDIFIKAVKRQRKVSSVRSFAKLYHNISLKKLASLMEVEANPDSVRSEILSVKNFSRELVASSGSALLKAEWQPSLHDVDFYVEDDIVHVQSLKPQREYVDYFAKQIARTQEIQGLVWSGKVGIANVR